MQAGDVALVLPDGTIEGFVGGVCTEHSVRAYALQSLQRGESMLLRILPFAEEGAGAGDRPRRRRRRGDGAEPCLSGGAIEVFLEPVLPAPRVLVVGDTPIAGRCCGSAPSWGSTSWRSTARASARAGDLALVVAAHGRDELHTLRLGLEAELPYVGLVASHRRGTGVLAELRGDGVPDALLARIDVPAGLDSARAARPRSRSRYWPRSSPSGGRGRRSSAPPPSRRPAHRPRRRRWPSIRSAG